MATPRRRPARPSSDGPTRAVGYLRVSTAEQAESGAGLDAQRATIITEAARRGWELIGIEVDAGASGKTLAGRPGVAAALKLVESGHADVLVVAKLDRLSRSVADFSTMLERALDRGWGFVALDLGVDTTTPAGELVANVMASVARWERRIIGQRTKEGLAAKAAEGVQLGRRAVLPQSVADRIRFERAAGRTLQAIADGLTESGVPTARGGAVWRPSSVGAVLTSKAPRESGDLSRATGVERSARGSSGASDPAAPLDQDGVAPCARE